MFQLLKYIRNCSLLMMLFPFIAFAQISATEADNIKSQIGEKKKMSEQLSPQSIEVVKNIYHAFDQGDIPTVFKLFDPHIEWVAAENSPAGKGSPYHGMNEVRDGVFMLIGSDFPGMKIKVDELFDMGKGKVVMLGYYVGVRKSTGKRFQAQVAHIWTINAGKAVKFQQYTDTYQLAESAK